MGTRVDRLDLDVIRKQSGSMAVSRTAVLLLCDEVERLRSVELAARAWRAAPALDPDDAYACSAALEDALDALRPLPYS